MRTLDPPTLDAPEAPSGGGLVSLFVLCFISIFPALPLTTPFWLGFLTGPVAALCIFVLWGCSRRSTWRAVTAAVVLLLTASYWITLSVPAFIFWLLVISMLIGGGLEFGLMIRNANEPSHFDRNYPYG